MNTVSKKCKKGKGCKYISESILDIYKNTNKPWQYKKQ